MPQDNIKKITKPNELLIPHIVEMINEGHTVTLGLKGRSMRPFLEDGRDKALLEKADEVSVGDAVLALIAGRNYVLHRIVAIDGDNITLRGDGNLNVEHCKRKDIHGKAIAFYRKGRTRPDRTDGRKWRIYSAVWTRLLPVRRYLLFAYRMSLKMRGTAK